MKPVYDLLICVAGWEDRFVEGVKSNLDSFAIQSVLLWRFEEFKEQTEVQTTAVLNHAWFHDIQAKEVSLRRHPEAVWNSLRQLYMSPSFRNLRVLLDITTMPREVIWWTLGYLNEASCTVDYVYYHPQSYSQEWLTRDTARPRLVYQYSGVAKLGKPTALLLLNGFDTERASQLVRFFEPRVLLIGAQVGSQFGNDRKNIEEASRFSKRMANVQTFEVDAFSVDAGFKAIEDNLRPLLDNYNVVAASLGPKTSAIALFRLVLKYPALALAYAPSRQFHTEYSLGIGERLFGRVAFESPAENSVSRDHGESEETEVR